MTFDIDSEQVAADQLAEDRAPLFMIELSTDAEDAESVMPELLYAVGILSG